MTNVRLRILHYLPPMYYFYCHYLYFTLCFKLSFEFKRCCKELCNLHIYSSYSFHGNTKRYYSNEKLTYIVPNTGFIRNIRYLVKGNTINHFYDCNVQYGSDSIAIRVQGEPLSFKTYFSL